MRRGYLDRSPGETRAVVTLDGRPERLVVLWEDDPTPRLGARYAARVEAVSERMGLARLDLGGAPATLKLRGPDARAAVGERLEVEVVAEPVRDKPAAVKRLGPTDARPGRIAPPPPAEAMFAALELADWRTDEAAREAADEAQVQALAPEHAFAHGLNLRIEPTRALVAVDLDLAEGGGSVARANAAGIWQAARLLRLKALGGLVALDLVGFPKEARQLQAIAAEAFAPDGGEVSVAPVSRFGVLELAKPHRRQPVAEQLQHLRTGEPSARAAAHALVRDLERQGRFEPGARLEAIAAPGIAALAEPWVRQLGPRFGVRADLGLLGVAYDIRSL